MLFDEPAFVAELARVRERLLDACGKLREASIRLERSHEAIAQLEEEVRDDEMIVAVVGEVNRGKSTFLNALLGRRVFPPSATVCTAVLTCLRDGEPRFEATDRRGQPYGAGTFPEDGQSSPLAKLVTRSNPSAAELAKVDAWVPNRFARHGVVLMDTPGVNDPVAWREDITVAALQRADAAIFLLDAHSPVTRTECDFLQLRVLGALVQRVVFVVNKCDQLTASDRELVRERCLREVGRYIPNPVVHLVSSREALLARLEGDAARFAASGFPELEAFLEGMLGEDRIALHFGARARRAERLRQQLLAETQTRLHAGRQDSKQIAGRVAAARERIVTAERTSKSRLDHRRTELASLPSRAATTAESAWRTEVNARVLHPSARARFATQEGARLKESVKDALQEARRAALARTEDALTEARRSVASAARDDIAALDRELALVRAEITGAHAPTALAAFELEADFSPRGGQNGAWVGLGVGGAALALAVGATGGLALALLGAGVLAEVFAASSASDHLRSAFSSLERDCERIGRQLSEDVRSGAKRFADAAIGGQERETRRQIEDERRTLKAIERDAQADTKAVDNQLARLGAIEKLLGAATVEGVFP